MKKTLLTAFVLIVSSPIATIAADFGGPLPYEMPARQRAKIQGVLMEGYAKDQVVRKQVNIQEIYGLNRGKALECNAAVNKTDPKKLRPWERANQTLVAEDITNVCIGR